MTRLLALAIVPFTIACGSSASGVGDLGNVKYTLHSDHVADGELRDVAIVTGHTQVLHTEVTADGARKVDTPRHSGHGISAEDAVISSPRDGRQLRDVRLMVPTPGTYTLRTRTEGELLDRIDLTFDAPTRIDLQTWVKGPDADHFDERNQGEVSVEVGAQVSLLPIPIANGDRLAGDYPLALTVEPASAAMIPADVHGVYEQSVWWSENEKSIIFVEEGEVTVTLTDAANGISATQTFQVDERD